MRQHFLGQLVGMNSRTGLSTLNMEKGIVRMFDCSLHIAYIRRLAYGVWLLNEIVERQPEGITLHLMYDIACNLVCHLRVYLILYVINDVTLYVGKWL